MSNISPLHIIANFFKVINGADSVLLDVGYGIKLSGDSTVWDDLRFPASMLAVPGSKSPVAVTVGPATVLGFQYQGVEVNEQEVSFVAQLPHSWVEGSMVDVHVHWTPDNAETASVRWGLEYEWINYDGSVSATTTIHADQAISGSADDLFKTDFPMIDGTGKTISSLILGRLFRNSSDVADDASSTTARLLELDFHYEINTMGSRTEMAK